MIFSTLGVVHRESSNKEVLAERQEKIKKKKKIIGIDKTTVVS